MADRGHPVPLWVERKGKVTEYRCMADFCGPAGICYATVSKYAREGREYKGMRFYFSNPTGREFHGVNLNPRKFKKDRRETLEILLDVCPPKTAKDARRIEYIVHMAKNLTELYRWRDQLILYTIYDEDIDLKKFDYYIGFDIDSILAENRKAFHTESGVKFGTDTSEEALWRDHPLRQR